MNKTTIIRNEKRHSVQVEEGTHLAQRRSQKKSSKLPQDEVDLTPQETRPVKAPKTKTVVMAQTPAPAAAKAKTPTQRATKTSKKPSPLPTPKSTKPSAPATPIWGQNDLVKHRIDALHARNAQLSEQLQRLPQTITARGNQP